MSQIKFPRMAALLLLSSVVMSALCGCTKRINTSSENKYYKSLTEVMNSLPASKQKEFDECMTAIWFYSKSDAETNALIDGKSGREILALGAEMMESLPKLDTSSKDAFETSLARMKESLPPSKINDFNVWAKELGPYRQGSPKFEALNGLTFQKIVENRDFTNGQNPDLRNQ